MTFSMQREGDLSLNAEWDTVILRRWQGMLVARTADIHDDLGRHSKF